MNSNHPEGEARRSAHAETHFTVRPRIVRIEWPGPDTIVVEFHSLIGQALILQATGAVTRFYRESF